MRRFLIASLILLALPAFALANPANELTDIPIEASVYDPATKCDDKPRRGVVKLQRWLEENVRGVFWGSYRMGVEELIWDCDRDHIHIGMTKAGAAGNTSFWRRHTG